MWIKICANTSLDDALMAAEFGADAVGFVFAPSRRQVTVAQVAAITPYMPAHVERVGVFGRSTPQEIAQAAEDSGLTGIQLHGAVPLAFADALYHRLGPQYKIIQTAHWAIEEHTASEERVSHSLQELAARTHPYRILVDAKAGSVSGGLGIPFDWSRAKPILTSQPSLEVIVAGGLTPQNVSEAIVQLRPYGVDVASGVECSPGRKDAEKVKHFINAARGTA